METFFYTFKNWVKSGSLDSYYDIVQYDVNFAFKVICFP